MNSAKIKFNWYARTYHKGYLAMRAKLPYGTQTLSFHEFYHKYKWWRWEDAWTIHSYLKKKKLLESLGES